MPTVQQHFVAEDAVVDAQGRVVSWPDRSGNGNCLQGQITEVAVFDRALSQVERERLEGHLANHYGALLPATHYNGTSWAASMSELGEDL